MGGPQAPTACAAQARPGPASLWGEPVSSLKVRAPRLTLRPRREGRAVPLSRRRAPRRPTVRPAGYSPLYCPASPWCRTERSASPQRGDQASAATEEGPKQVLRPTPHPTERAAPRGPAAAGAHSATYRLGGEAGARDHLRFPGVAWGFLSFATHPVQPHWRRKWQPTPVLLPGESQGRRSLVGCRLWGRTESDTTEAT